MRQWLTGILIAAWVLTPFTVVQAQENVTREVLDNGLTVIVNPMPDSPVVSVFMLVKTGSATEGKYIGSGISHFVEHMLFKGTHERGVGEIASQVQAMGGTINAATSYDYTIYTITLPAEHVSAALGILADALMHSNMPEEEVEREREVIVSEMRMHDDNPDRKINEWMMNNAFLRHPYRHPIIGYKSLLLALSREDLMDYYRLHYVPNNMILAVSGGVVPAEVLPEVKDLFSAFERTSYEPRNLPVEPAQITPRRMERVYPTEDARVVVAYPTVSLLHADLYALDVLANILGQGRSSRLYRDLLEEQHLVQSVYVINYTPVDPGLFEIKVKLKPEHLDATLARIETHLEQVRTKGVTDQELIKAKQQVKSQHIMGQQTSSDLAYRYAFDEAFTGDLSFSEHYVEGVERVTAEDIQKVAHRYLSGNRKVVTILSPRGAAVSTGESEGELVAHETEKTVLANGLTVLLKPDPAHPLISVRLVMRGGTREDPQDKEGLSNLLSQTWIKGTKGRSAEEIAELVESRGMLLDAFSGRNSMGLSMEFLKEDWPLALDLLNDLTTAPLFAEEPVERYKDLTLSALRSRKDSIHHYSVLALKERLFPRHPFARDLLGTETSVPGIAAADIQRFYKEMKTPQNMVLAVYGDIEADTVMKDLQSSRLGKLTQQPLELNRYELDELSATIDDMIQLDKQQAMVLVGFRAPNMFDEEQYGVEVLTSVLGSSFSGRMFTRIRDQFGQAYTLGGQYAPGIETGMIYFYILTSPDNVEEAKQALLNEIEKIKTTEPVTDAELRNIQEYLAGTYQIAHQTNSEKAFVSALDELYGRGHDRWREYPAKIRAVTASQVQELAETYLDVGRAVILLTVPPEDESAP